jgi:hypothetical protein
MVWRWLQSGTDHTYYSQEFFMVSRSDTDATNPGRKLLYLAAGLSVIAALMHVWEMKSHYEEWWAFGVFFLLLAVAQWLYGLALPLRPSKTLFQVGIAGTLAVIALYVVNHSTGVPFFGPHAGMPEPVTTVGLVCKGVEIALAITLWGLLQGRRVAQLSAPRLTHQA